MFFHFVNLKTLQKRAFSFFKSEKTSKTCFFIFLNLENASELFFLKKLKCCFEFASISCRKMCGFNLCILKFSNLLVEICDFEINFLRCWPLIQKRICIFFFFYMLKILKSSEYLRVIEKTDFSLRMFWWGAHWTQINITEWIPSRKWNFSLNLKRICKFVFYILCKTLIYLEKSNLFQK